MGEVDGLGLLGQSLDLAARVVVTLLEGLEGGGGLATEAERAGDLDPVDLESGAALFGELAIVTIRSEAILVDAITYGSHFEEFVLEKTGGGEGS